MTDTIAALSTPPGKSAIGVLRLSGPAARQIALAIFLPDGGEPPPRTMALGTLTGADAVPIDRCMAVFFEGPESYTGEDMIEVYCHGSLPVLYKALEAMYIAGARPARAGEFTRRALLNGKMGLLEVEATGALIAAETEEAAKNAAAQLSGVLHREIAAAYDLVLNVLAHFQAIVDYPEEDIAAFEIPDTIAALSGVRSRLAALTDGFERGQVLQEGVPTVIIGRPNVGKSSLLNAITGTDRSIVTTLAGTTRDIVETHVKFGGVALRLMDTAGIRKARDEAEAIGVQKALRAAADAALVLLVIDASEKLKDEDMQVIDAALGRPAVVILNKSDKPTQVKAADFGDDFGYIIEASATTGKGISDIEAAIREIFNTDGLRYDGTLLVSARQHDACRKAIDALDKATSALSEGSSPDMVLYDVECAMMTIGELLGKNTPSDVLDKIFENFCVGK